MSEFPKEIWAAKEGQFGQGVDPIRLAPWTESVVYEGAVKYIRADTADHLQARLSEAVKVLEAVSHTSHIARDRRNYRFPVAVMERVDAFIATLGERKNEA